MFPKCVLVDNFNNPYALLDDVKSAAMMVYVITSMIVPPGTKQQDRKVT